MNWAEVFDELLWADQEEDAIARLRAIGVWDDPAVWRELGDNENNFSIVSNQQTDPTGAMVEKIINSVDATLMAACHQTGISPEGNQAPQTMAEAAEHFFGIRRGRLGDLTSTELTELAVMIQLIAVGSKQNPSYLIIDTEGEGQTPASFPDTFCSLAKSNKLRIPFVQGKFNAGGTGVLQFCGRENLQLVASRRHPGAPVTPGDTTSHLWGFTLIRRLEPYGNRKNSTYVYLAPNGLVPCFEREALLVLPGDSRKNEPARPYEQPMRHGSIIKLYDYRWSAKSVATTDARFELEKYLHAPTLPFRITETRPYRAHYYSTTVSGVWASIHGEEGVDQTKRRVEDGFPTLATLSLQTVGELQYRTVVFKEEKVDVRRIPSGVFFTVNGQVHGSLPPNFVSQALQFEYLKDHLFVSVDCTAMETRVREDFFMASRDRLRRNEDYQELYNVLKADLREHPGLKELNAARRARRIKESLENEKDVLHTLDQLLERDPALRTLFDLGDRLVTKVGPTEAETFEGARFPTFFRIKGKRELLKDCPINGTVRVEFETDAANDYFDRDNSPGEFLVSPPQTLEHSRLWNGTFSTRWRLPQGVTVGDSIEIVTTVSDPDREARGLAPFDNRFTLRVVEARSKRSSNGPRRGRKGPDEGQDHAPRLALPRIIEVRRDEWAAHPNFHELTAFRVRRSGDGKFDYFVNMDNAYLLTELTRSNSDRDVITYWFKWGLTLCAMGMLQHLKKVHGDASAESSLDTEDILHATNLSLDGLGAVIVPVIRNLYRGPED